MTLTVSPPLPHANILSCSARHWSAMKWRSASVSSLPCQSGRIFTGQPRFTRSGRGRQRASQPSFVGRQVRPGAFSIFGGLLLSVMGDPLQIVLDGKHPIVLVVALLLPDC